MWIHIDEALPAHHQKVFVHLKYGDIRDAWLEYNGDGTFYWYCPQCCNQLSDSDVTHWMLKPMPPMQNVASFSAAVEITGDKVTSHVDDLLPLFRDLQYKSAFSITKPGNYTFTLEVNSITQDIDV